MGLMGQMGTWMLTDHACCHCHGRLLLGSDEEGSRVRCANCGASHAWVERKARKDGEPPPARAVQDLCCCSVRVGPRQVLECIKVPPPRALGSPEVGVRAREAQASQPATRVPRYVAGD